MANSTFDTGGVGFGAFGGFQKVPFAAGFAVSGAALTTQISITGYAKDPTTGNIYVAAGPAVSVPNFGSSLTIFRLVRDAITGYYFQDEQIVLPTSVAASVNAFGPVLIQGGFLWVPFKNASGAATLANSGVYRVQLDLSAFSTFTYTGIPASSPNNEFWTDGTNFYSTIAGSNVNYWTISGTNFVSQGVAFNVSGVDFNAYQNSQNLYYENGNLYTYGGINPVVGSGLGTSRYSVTGSPASAIVYQNGIKAESQKIVGNAFAGEQNGNSAFPKFGILPLTSTTSLLCVPVLESDTTRNGGTNANFQTAWRAFVELYPISRA